MTPEQAADLLQQIHAGVFFLFLLVMCSIVRLLLKD